MSFNTLATTHGTPASWGRKKSPQEQIADIANQTLQVQRGSGQAIDAGSRMRALRQATQQVAPHKLAEYDEMMRQKRAQQVEDESNRTALELAKEKLRQFKSRSSE